MTRAAREIDRILARGYLGGPTHDAILAKVMTTTTGAAGRAGWRLQRARIFLGATAAMAAAAAAAVFVFPSKQSFTARGADTGALAGAVQLACRSGDGQTCPVGDTLMFMVNSAMASGYFGAYAEPADPRATPGERIWYFPSASRAAPPFVAAGTGMIVLPRGIKIGAEHRPGPYRVTVWLSRRPVQRAEVDTAGPETILGRSTMRLVVTE